MRLSAKDFLELSNLAVDAASQAGELIGSYTSKNVKATQKEAGTSMASQVVTEVDYLSQELILKILAPTFEKFDLGLLTEESVDDKSRFEKDYFWCIDPLDGTLPFTESVPGFAVSIALVSKEGIPVIGIVFDPLNKILYRAIKGKGAFRNNDKWKAKQINSALSIITDRSFLMDDRFDRLKSLLSGYAKEQGYSGVDVICQGGAAMNACWVLEKAPAIYIKFPKKEEGGGSLWDFGATACLLGEAGAVVSDVYGNPLDLNRYDSTFMNHRGVLYSSTPQLAQVVLEV